MPLPTDNREVVRGLMRGHRPEHKQGYSAAAAVAAVADVRSIRRESREHRDLAAYADGFAAGMAEEAARTLPADGEPLGALGSRWLRGEIYASLQQTGDTAPAYDALAAVADALDIDWRAP